MGNAHPNIRVEESTAMSTANTARKSVYPSEGSQQSEGDSQLPSRARKKNYSFTYEGKRVVVAEKEIVSHLFPGKLDFPFQSGTMHSTKGSVLLAHSS